MLTNNCIRLASNFFTYSALNLRKVILLPFPATMVVNSTNAEIKTLFNRLRNANKQAEILKREVCDIKSQILLLTDSELFENLDVDLLDGGGSPTQNSDKRKADDSSASSSKKPKFDFRKNGDYVVVFTDGACENNGGKNAKAGIGVWFADGHPLNVSEPVTGKATNNTAEIQACIWAVTRAIDNGIKKLEIVTDSQFTINCITKWMPKWKKNNWRLSSGGDVKNKVDLKKLDDLCQQVDVKWQHVAGHSGVHGNEQADNLAKSGASRYRP